MQGKNRDTYTGCSWLGSSRVGGGGWCGWGDGQCININKRGGQSQWEEIQVTVCQSRVHHRLWGGGLFSHDRCMNSMVAMDVIGSDWSEIWGHVLGPSRLIGDMRSCVGLKGREAEPPVVTADGMWWCGADVTASTHEQVVIPRKNGVLELAHIAENDTRSSREGDQKNTSLRKAPFSPQVHTADIPRDSRRHMAKKAKIS